jgi:uncharacterized protein with HEPN domain
MRHRIVHEYFGIDKEIVWHVVTKDLIPLKKQLKELREGLIDTEDDRRERHKGE